jgi:transcriptional regulator with XRE-family HTH domain
MTRETAPLTGEQSRVIKASPEPDFRAMIGQNLRRLRSERRLTLEALAARAGVSRAMLSQIERGESVPTINLVWKLARAFELPFSVFMSPPAGYIHELPAATAEFLVSKSGHLRSRALFPRNGGPRVELYEVRLKAGATEESQPHPTGTTENLVVTRGAVTIAVGDAEHLLNAGDAIQFPGDEPHAYRNPTPEEAVLYLVISYRRDGEV